MKTLPLPFTVGEARSTLREALNCRGIAIFSELDYTREAFNDLLTIPASVIFSFAPRMPLWHVLRMAPALGAELPLKIQLWQDANLHNWCSFTDIPALLTQYNAQNLAHNTQTLQLTFLMNELITLLTQQPSSTHLPTPSAY